MSRGVTGMSPQSRMVKGVEYGLRAARWLKPRKEVWREEAARMARGPNRAPVGSGCQNVGGSVYHADEALRMGLPYWEGGRKEDPNSEQTWQERTSDVEELHSSVLHRNGVSSVPGL